jgi:hypothetical protein
MDVLFSETYFSDIVSIKKIFKTLPRTSVRPIMKGDFVYKPLRCMRNHRNYSIKRHVAAAKALFTLEERQT